MGEMGDRRASTQPNSKSNADLRLRFYAVIIPILAILANVAAASGQHSHGGGGAAEKPAMLLPGMGDLHHPISTRIAEAQKFFDQGLTLAYGFNRPEALRSFRRTAELDPRAVMAYWGIALVLGPHINMDMDGDVQPKEAYEAIKKAMSMLSEPPENERA